MNTADTSVRAAYTLETAMPADLVDLAPLFEAYRQFYGCPDHDDQAYAFLAERLQSGDSHLYLLRRPDRQLAGFAQVYPAFSSLKLCRVWIINDLFIVPEERGKALGEMLLARIEQDAINAGIGMLTMETTPENVKAQRLYQKMGYAREMGYLHFIRRLS